MGQLKLCFFTLLCLVELEVYTQCLGRGLAPNIVTNGDDGLPNLVVEAQIASFSEANQGLEAQLSSINAVNCKPLLFVFGASMADTGELSSAMPFFTNADFPPYGQDYFSRPTGRWSNGRVFTDFISQRLGNGLLNPYLKSVNSNFTLGANFASAGSTARYLNNAYMFSFPIQVNQYRELLFQMLNQSSTLNLGYSQQQIREAIYLFETANNDYVYQFGNTTDFDALALVMDVLSSIEGALRVLYSYGARNFVVMTLTPLGCTPTYLVLYPSFEVDEYGCIIFFNEICQLHNKYLENLLSNLTIELPDANWILFDAYSIFLDGYRNPSKYGIEHPFISCCGAGGEHNYVDDVPCGSSGYVNGTYMEATPCSDPSLYLIWDGIHPVESFARHMAKGVLSGEHLWPTFNITSTCLNIT